MADVPNCPRGREEEYLADMAGENGTKPANPWSRKEAYLDAIDGRMDGIEEDIENLKNNPDVVDVVNTYADLQAYDKTKLTDNDIIRVLNDETHDGESTYYRYSTATQAFTYIGTTKQYTNFVGTDGTAAGEAGLVPAPATTDAGKYLKADGTWETVQAGPTVVQTTGTSTTDVMSQDATSKMIFPNPSTKYRIAIGLNANAGATDANCGVAIGLGTTAQHKGSVAIGYGANTAHDGQVTIQSSVAGYGYNNTVYRLLSGLHDPQNAHDAATKGYVDALVGNIESALHAINNGGNA